MSDDMLISQGKAQIMVSLGFISCASVIEEKLGFSVQFLTPDKKSVYMSDSHGMKKNFKSLDSCSKALKKLGIFIFQVELKDDTN